ncbi:unnamed protein product [Urochloa humidicola]
MPEDEAEAAAQQTPCAGCKTLRRRCVPGCVFAPYFPADGGDDPSRFAAVHRVFGASNVARMLGVVAHPKDRRRAAETLVEEARARLRDPALGCHSYVAILQMLNEKAREQVDATRAEIAAEFGAAAAAEPVDPAAAPPEVRAEAREQAERALAQAREKDAKLLAARRADDVEWWQQHRAAKHAGGSWKKNRDTSKQVAAETENTGAAAGDSTSEQTMVTPAAAVGAEMESQEGNGHLRGKTAETQEPATAAEVVREEKLASEHAPAAAPPHHDSAATTQHAGAGTSFLDREQLAAAEVLAKRLDTIKRRWAAGQQYHVDPAAARHAAAGLDVAPRRMPDARVEAAAAVEAEAASGQDLMVMMLAQEFAEAGAAEQGTAMQLLAAGAAQYGGYDGGDAQVDVTLVRGHQDMRQQMTVAASAGKVAGAGEQVMAVRHAAAAELAGQEMMMQLAEAQYAQLDVTLGHVPPQEIVHQIASAAKVATAELAGEQEMELLLQVAAELQNPTAQYSETKLGISLGQGHPYGHQPTAQEFAGEQELILLQLADTVGVAGEPNTAAATQNVATAYKDSEHGNDYGAAVAFQPPGLAEAVPFLVEQRPPPQGQTRSALGLQMDSSLLPLPSLGQQLHAQVTQQKSTDGGEEGQSSDLTAYLFY